MRYKTYTWPHNPRVYTIEYQREMSCRKVPFGRYHLQDLGMTRRVMKGEGEFVGPDAYDQFKKLASVFYSEGPGVLVHPVWQMSSAYFTQLSLAQEPRADYVRYTFTFWENYDGYKAQPRRVNLQVYEGAVSSAAGPGGSAVRQEAQFHTVQPGDSLWAISNRYGIPVPKLIELNPWLKNPNLIRPGERVRMA